jgi:hypothetical protein
MTEARPTNPLPTLYQADTLWMLPRRPVEEADRLFALRKAQGYTAVQMQLTGFLGMTNVEGRLPFGPAHDLSLPDERYFAHIDALLECARAHGLYVALAPLWYGCCREGWAGRGEDGAWKPMNAQGEAVFEGFGRWLGARYAHHTDLLWILGGDNDPWSVDAVELTHAIARGLKAGAAHLPCTYHASSTHSSTDVFPDAPWLDVSMVYTYHRLHRGAWNRAQPDVGEVCALERHKEAPLPFFLGESTYEGEHLPWGSAHQVRKQAWAACLGGAVGHAYGSTNWRCDDDGLQASLPGAESLRHLPETLLRFGWPNLIPDKALPTRPNDSLAAATAESGSARLVYVPSPRPIDVGGIGWERTAWLDPTSGEEVEVKPESVLTPPERTNAGGDSDWVLLQEREAR